MGIALYVGGQRSGIDLDGYRCFSAAYSPNRGGSQKLSPLTTKILLDSGAFTHSPTRRLSFEQALQNQLNWEIEASLLWNDGDVFHKVTSYAISSYDVLIDELWIGDTRIKQRWSESNASWAVDETIKAAAFLASKREYLHPRHLVLGCQGVSDEQYEYCVKEILKFSHPEDWIGLGGWCILGRFTSWMPTFKETILRVVPMIAAAGIKHVHIYGVLYLPALGNLLWMCDRYGLTCSTDSSAPILSCTRKDSKRAGVRAEGWRNNVAWWQAELFNLRSSQYYKQPISFKQLSLL